MGHGLAPSFMKVLSIASSSIRVPRARRSCRGAARALGAALLLVGGLTSLGVAQLPSEGDRAAPSVDTSVVDTSTSAALRAAQVAIAVGDRVRVRVWREPTMSDDLTVDERGEIAVPRLGVVRVAGRTIAAMQDTLRGRFAEYLRNPAVSITVLRRVGVQGEVRAPNVYFVDATTTLREVLAQAGGVTEIGNPNDISIVRDGRTIRLGRLRRGGPPSADLRSGDQVIIGRTSWLSRNALAVVSTVGFIVTVAIQVVNAQR